MSANAVDVPASIIKQSDTGPAGVAMVNGTPGILSWTVPNDGQAHRVSVVGDKHVTVNETGGAVTMSWASPDGGAGTSTLFAGGQAAGLFGSSLDRVVQAGSVVTVQQSSALTVGASVLFAQIWGI